MASPTVANTNTSAVTGAGTSHTVNLPANIAAGNLLIVVFGLNVSGSTLTWPAEFTAITGFRTNNTGGDNQSIDAAYRWADGTEGSTISVTTGTSSKSEHTSYRITGAMNPATQAPECGTGATGGGAADGADPPNASVTGGSKDILAIACMAIAGETFTGGAAPTNYTNLLTNNSGTGGAVGTNGMIQTAQRQLTASSEDPGTFQHDSTLVWVAQTIIVHPGAASQSLTGTLFTKAPTFNAGPITSVRNLAGTLFVKAPTFSQGLVQNQNQPLDGALFQKAPTFPQGTVASIYDLDGQLFQKAPTFSQGTIAATFNLAGQLFQKAPTFNTGAATSTYNLAGQLFTKAPSFSQGAIASVRDLAGTLFQQAPTFPTGTITQEGGPQPLGGVLFQKSPTFSQGTVSPGAVDLAGQLFTKAPMFNQGAIGSIYGLAGQLFAKSPTFSVGSIRNDDQFLTGTLFQNTPVFFQGSIGNQGALDGILFASAPSFFSGAVTQSGGSFWRPNPAGYSLDPADYTVNPAGYDPVLRDEVPPWPIEIHGELFENDPAFFVGAMS